ncbi:diguanylate cyclase with GGDEF domain [Paraburkholderia sp. BL6665CI2N2]|nr:diguanylate cyclase with GGDEF domain [Paraburkholderia sp. BL6665CI2N2]
MLAKAGTLVTHESKLFGCWRGEEFGAALPGADAGLARTIADNPRRCLVLQDFEHTWRVKPIPFTVSIGEVIRETAERDVDALMRRGDRAKE